MKKIYYYSIVSEVLCNNGSERLGANAKTEFWFEGSARKIQIQVHGATIAEAKEKLLKLMKQTETVEVNREFYLCSKEVAERMKLKIISKPLIQEGAEVYIGLLNFEELNEFYHAVIVPEYAGKNIDEMADFWANECSPGAVDVSKITMRKIKNFGLFPVIFEATNLSTSRNLAMVIRNIADREGISVFDLFNKIAK